MCPGVQRLFALGDVPGGQEEDQGRLVDLHGEGWEISFLLDNLCQRAISQPPDSFQNYWSTRGRQLALLSCLSVVVIVFIVYVIEGTEPPDFSLAVRRRFTARSLTQELCLDGTRKLLKELGELGYQVSAKKAQLCRSEVPYLGYALREARRWLTEARKKTVMQIPTPTTPRQVREILGTAGFCRLWIPGFAMLVAPLYPLTKEKVPVTWTEEHQRAFDKIKTALLTAPTLTLPDLTKSFTLYVDERAGVACGVLTQALGPWKRPVAYLSKKLDPVTSGWPSCLKAIAAVALLVNDADKLTLGQHMTVIAPHALESIVRQPPDCWMTNAWMTHYQSLLLNDRITFAPPAILKPATLLPEVKDSTPVHRCTDVMAEETGTRKDLTDQPWPGVPNWYTDGSSFVVEGKRRAGAAVVDGKQVIWASSLPEGTSAQKGELLALTQALRLAEVKAINIYTDSRYAFAMAHIHGAIYR
ncbi:hypothetical protein NN561_017847 [Cricetulus griseus]